MNASNASINSINNKKKIMFTRYTKLFGNFQEGVEDLCDRSEYIFDLLKKHSSVDECGIPKTMMEMNKTITNIISNKYPNKINQRGSDLLWEFNISGNRTTVKTDNYIGFGYSAYISKIQNNTIINYLFSIDVYGDRQEDLINMLEEMNWKKYEPKNKQRPVKKEESVKAEEE